MPCADDPPSLRLSRALLYQTSCMVTLAPAPESAVAPTASVLARAYLVAKRTVVEHGYAHEVLWQSTVTLSALTPTVFVSEAAWVVLSAGMRESVVDSIYRRLGPVFHEWDVCRMADDGALLFQQAYDVFRHEGKLRAIIEIARAARRLDTDGLRHELLLRPEDFLRSLPYIGPVTWRHLAKNLGLQVAKHDRHLSRIAANARRQSVDVLCQEIASETGEPVPVVDLVLWRWSVIHARICPVACVEELQVLAADGCRL